MAIDVNFVELLELSPSAREQRFYLYARAVSSHASAKISPVGGFPLGSLLLVCMRVEFMTSPYTKT